MEHYAPPEEEVPKASKNYNFQGVSPPCLYNHYTKGAFKMKLINIHRKHIDMELELNVHNWKDAVGLVAIIVAIVALITWLIMK